MSDPGMTNKEIELKLIFTPVELARFRRSRVLSSMTSGKAVQKYLRATYFDTADHDLASRKVSLRVRKEGPEWRQTLKSKGSGTGGVMVRGECETTVAGPALEPDQLRQFELYRNLEEQGLPERLEPVLTTTVRRTIRNIAFGASRIEMAIDTGKVEANSKASEICEVELELVEGDAQDVLALAQDIHADFSFRIGTVSKAQRGFNLINGNADNPVAAAEEPLAKGQSCGQAGMALIGEAVALLLKNETALFDGRNDDALLPMRDALVRISDAVEVFGKRLGKQQAAGLEADLDWIIEHLDTAVAWRSVSFHLDDTAAEDSKLDALRADVDKATVAAVINARAALQDARYTAFILALEAWLHRPLKTDKQKEALDRFAAKSLNKIRTCILMKAGGDITGLSAKELRKLLKHLNRFRMMQQAAMSGYGEKKTRSLFKATGKLSRAVSQALFLAEMKDRLASLEQGGGKAQLRKLQRKQLRNATEKLETTWRKFSGLRPYWK